MDDDSGIGEVRDGFVVVFGMNKSHVALAQYVARIKNEEWSEIDALVDKDLSIFNRDFRLSSKAGSLTNLLIQSATRLWSKETAKGDRAAKKNARFSIVSKALEYNPQLGTKVLKGSRPVLHQVVDKDPPLGLDLQREVVLLLLGIDRSLLTTKAGQHERTPLHVAANGKLAAVAFSLYSHLPLTFTQPMPRGRCFNC